MPDLDRWPWALAAYAAAAFAVCFWRLGSFGLIYMEGIVANGGRGMLASGDWLVPTLYGEIYTYKPALAYWLSAFAHALADPPPAWLLRLPFAAAPAVMGLFILFLVGRLAGMRVGTLCAIASISGGLVVEKARLAEFDGVLTAGVGVAVTAACYNLAARTPRTGVWVLGYLGLAVGFLVKGIPALMVYLPGALAAAWATGTLRRLLDRRHLTALALFTAIAGGYLAGVERASGSDAFVQPFIEAKVRGFGWLWRQEGEVLSQAEGMGIKPSEAAVMGDPTAALSRTMAKPALILAAFFPWGFLIPFALSKRAWSLATRETAALRTAAGAFFLAGVAAFVAVPTHEMRYYMPLAAPVGILAGLVALEARRGKPERWRPLWAATVGLACLAAALTILAGLVLESRSVPALNRAVISLAGTLALCGAIHLTRLRPRGGVGILALLAALCLIASQNLGFHVARAANRDLSAQAAELSRYLQRDEPVWLLGPADLPATNASLFFYLDRPLRVFRHGEGAPPAGSVCLVASDRFAALTATEGFSFEEIARSEHVWRDFILGRCSGAS